MRAAFLALAIGFAPILRKQLFQIKRVSGVGDVKNFTAQDYSMRVWSQPNKIAALGITPEDIANAIREPNAQTPAVWQNYNNVFKTRL